MWHIIKEPFDLLQTIDRVNLNTQYKFNHGLKKDE